MKTLSLFAVALCAILFAAPPASADCYGCLDFRESVEVDAFGFRRVFVSSPRTFVGVRTFAGLRSRDVDVRVDAFGRRRFVDVRTTTIRTPFFSRTRTVIFR